MKNQLAALARNVKSAFDGGCGLLRYLGGQLRKFLFPNHLSLVEVSQFILAWGTILIAIGLAFYIVPRLNKTVVLVNTVSLPESYVHAGYSQSVFTENLVGAVQSEIGLLQTPEADSFHSAADAKTNCLDENLLLLELRAELSKKLPIPKDFEIRYHNPSSAEPRKWLEAISIMALEMLGRTGATISADVREIDGGLVFEATSSFPSGNVHTTQVHSPDMASLQVKARDQIIKLATPWRYAASRLLDDPDGVDQAVEISMKEFPNRVDASLLFAIQGFSKYHRSVFSEGAVTNPFESRKYFQKALDNNSSHYLSMVGNAMSTLDLYFIESTDKSLIGPEKSELTGHLYTTAIDQLDRSITLKPDNPAAYYFLAKTFYKRGQRAEADKNKDLFAHKSANAQRALALIADFFISIGELELAEKEIAHVSEMATSSDTNLATEILLLRARLAATKNSWDSFGTLAKQVIKTGSPCGAYTLAQVLYNSGESLDTQNSSKGKFLEDAHFYYSKAEEYGMRGFHFYNSWGSLLQKMGEYDLAIEKYTYSLQFYGDHLWALLNWGHILNKQKLFGEAEKKYLESLSLGKTGAAVRGYLDALFSQGKYKSLIERYTVYSRTMELGTAFAFKVGYAHCSVGSIKEAKAFLEQIPFNFANNFSIIQLKSCIRDKSSN